MESISRIHDMSPLEYVDRLFLWVDTIVLKNMCYCNVLWNAILKDPNNEEVWTCLDLAQISNVFKPLGQTKMEHNSIEFLLNWNKNPDIASRSHALAFVLKKIVVLNYTMIKGQRFKKIPIIWIWSQTGLIITSHWNQSPFQYDTVDKQNHPVDFLYDIM